ncbi:response regulator [Chondrinema litorale]|uniref:response regulator n=1 Tax=Chondrinema litorale TaxID=2994555 RepID=UPI00254397FE|nr:response regulator [Chondrinema litorale]UZR98195.1 response regulator [Chondrinema litorale]
MKNFSEEKQLKTALVVDDETNLCFLLKNLLTRMNYQVSCTSTLAEAVKEYNQYKPDIIFLDIHLPDGLGYTLLEQLRNRDEHTYVVMMSSETQFNKLQKDLLKRADRFLKKPFRLKEVVEIVSN